VKEKEPGTPKKWHTEESDKEDDCRPKAVNKKGQVQAYADFGKTKKSKPRLCDALATPQKKMGTPTLGGGRHTSTRTSDKKGQAKKESDTVLQSSSTECW